MDLDRFCRKTKAAAFREAASSVRGGLDKISRQLWHPFVDQALRHAAAGLDEKARELEQGQD